MKDNLGFQAFSRSFVFIFDLPGQTESLVPYGPDAEDTQSDRGYKNGQQENKDESFLSFDGKL
jgi:hypothetical protein